MNIYMYLTAIVIKILLNTFQNIVHIENWPFFSLCILCLHILQYLALIVLLVLIVTDLKVL